MARQPQHRAFVIAAGLLALASALAFGVLAWRNIGGPRGPVPAAQLATESYVPAIAEMAPVHSETWNPPPAQPRGRDWVYDTFTPPEIFYNARSRQFTVRPPAGVSDGPEEAFGLELISVRPDPFRLQLIGYVGGEGHWRGTFENVVTGEVFLASAGEELPKLGLTIRSLDVRSQAIPIPDSMSTHQRVATAVVRDVKTGRDITLTHRERRYTGTMSALVAPAGEDAAREVRAGDTFKIGDATYRIDKIQLAPPGIDVTKESPALGQPDRRTLVPRETDAPESPESP